MRISLKLFLTILIVAIVIYVSWRLWLRVDTVLSAGFPLTIENVISGARYG